MSSIDGISISISLQPSGPAASGPTTRAVRSAEREGDDDDGARVRHGHGHGESRGQGSLQSALMQALQSLGLTGASVTPSTTTPAASTGTGTVGTTTPAASTPATDPGAAPGSSVSAADTLKADIRSFMHALFQAVRAAQPAAPSTSPAATNESTAAASASTGTTPVATASGATTAPSASAANITITINIGTQSGYGGHSRFGEHQGRRMQFAAGLGAVISQVSNNQAPTQLQDAFAKVLADLQPAAPASGTGTGTQVTLQALLTQLQQNLGYGAAGSASPLGNSVNSVA